MTHVTIHGCVDPHTGQRNGPAIARAIAALVSRHYLPVAPREAREAVEQAVRKEESYVAKCIADSIEDEKFLVAYQAKVRELAARYEFDVERLQFEVNRRSFGSFTTTLDGSPEQRDLYWAALKLAWEHQRAMVGHQEAAE